MQLDKKIYTYKVKVSYHGALFFGWAIQTIEYRTIQDLIQKKLSNLFKIPIKIVGSGRTDKGVHAFEQIFSFQIKNVYPIAEKNILSFLQKKCTNDIYFHYVKKVNNSFHAQFSSKNKTYLYLINQKFCLNLIHLAWLIEDCVDINKIIDASKLFLGTHNFASYTTSNKKENMIRTINFIKIKKTSKLIKIEINANGFLRSMVRMIVGSLIAYAMQKISLEKIQYNLSNPKKGTSNFKAPSSGLYLKKIFYK